MAEEEEEGQVEHQIAKGISKRMVGWAGLLVLDERRLRLVGGASAVSRVEGGW